MSNTVFKKVLRKVASLRSRLSHRVELLIHQSQIPALSEADQKIADGLKQNSVHVTTLAELGIASTSELLQAAALQLQDMEAALNRQVTNEPFGSVKNPAYPQIFTVTDLPQFYEWGCQPRLLNIIETYIGLPVQFQGVHLRRDFANDSPATTEFWHRDLEDHRMVKIFVYLTDATDEYGPLEYIPKSTVSYWMSRRIQKFIARFPERLGLTDDEMAQFIPRSQWQRCAVPAEAVVFADPIAVFHHGKPRQQERAALFFVYTSAKPLHPEFVTQYHDDRFARPMNPKEVVTAR